MNLVITGATGFVGREIVRQARAGGHTVRAIVRDPRAMRAWDTGTGIELVRGDVTDAPSLTGVMQGVDCVIHLVGIIHERKPDTFEKVHAEGTKNIVEAARSAGVNRFLHMSALGTRAGARSRYHQTKWAAEECVRNSGLAWTIIRPSVIYGPEDLSINVLTSVMRRLPFVPVLGDGRANIQPVAVETVARAFVAAITLPASIAKTYALCGPVAFSWNELYDRLLAFYSWRKPKLHLPLPIARCLAALFETILRQPPFTRDQLLMIEEDNVGDPAPAVRDFALQLESFEQGLARNLKR